MIAYLQARALLTCNTGQKLSCKALYLTARKRHEYIRFQKVKHTLTKQVRDYANMIAEVEAVSEMDALVPIFSVV